MRLDLLTVPKYRTCAQEGDDVPLVLPGAVFGAFDGATDPLGTVVEGIGTGRLAALTAAAAVAELALEPGGREMPGAEFLARISERLASRSRALDLPVPPSTTLALAIDCGDRWRFLALGDTGIRINAAETLRREKPIDAVSAHARIAVFRALAGGGPGTDETEAAARRTILLGLEAAARDGILPRSEVDRIIDDTVRCLGFERHRDEVTGFLLGGIRSQFRFANDPNHVLGFDTLNGTLPQRGELIDTSRPKREVHTIEIFTDGYPAMPETASVDAWEAAFARADSEDPRRIDRYPAVKGTTTAEFFDDRTIIVLDHM